MRLEHRSNFLVGIQLTDRLSALCNLCRMVSIVAEQYYLVGLELKIKPTVNASKSSHSLSNFFVSHTIEVCQRHSCDTIFYINAHGHS